MENSQYKNEIYFVAAKFQPDAQNPPCDDFLFGDDQIIFLREKDAESKADELNARLEATLVDDMSADFTYYVDSVLVDDRGVAAEGVSDLVDSQAIVLLAEKSAADATDAADAARAFAHVAIKLSEVVEESLAYRDTTPEESSIFVYAELADADVGVAEAAAKEAKESARAAREAIGASDTDARDVAAGYAALAAAEAVSARDAKTRAKIDSASAEFVFAQWQKIKLATKSATSFDDCKTIEKFEAFLRGEGEGPTMGEVKKLPVQCREYLLDTCWLNPPMGNHSV